MSWSTTLTPLREALERAGDEKTREKAAEQFAEGLTTLLEGFAAPEDAKALAACVEAAVKGLPFQACWAVGPALAKHIERLDAAVRRWAACPDQLLVPNEEHPHVSLWTGDIADLIYRLATELMLPDEAKARWAKGVPEAFAAHLPYAYGGLYAGNVVEHDPAAMARLVTVTLRAKPTEHPRFAMAQGGLLWSTTRPIREGKKGVDLRGFGRALLAEAKAWSDAEFDAFVQHAITSDGEPMTPRSFAKSPQRLAVLAALAATGRRSPGAARLAAFVEEANGAVKAAKARKEAEPKPPADAVEIRDFGFKLALIQAVMYEAALLPKFDVYAFAEAYEKREIDVQSEGYDQIPEAKRFFQKLQLSAAHLATIERLSPDGGDEVYLNIAPFWGGEESWFDIKSLAGIEHCVGLREVRFDALMAFPAKELERLLACPSLRKVAIHSLAESRPAKKVIEELRRREVELAVGPAHGSSASWEALCRGA